MATLSTGNAMNALQGKVSGLQISNSGTPGSTPRVIIRGVTTVNGSNPLYVVDGMPVGIISISWIRMILKVCRS